MIKPKCHLLFTALFAFFLIISCKEGKKENVDEVKTKELAMVQYQCPMDCEDGKTYHEEGSCPVCKMDLKEVKEETSMTYTMHKDGKCKCEGDKCACSNCTEHGKKMTCRMHEDGNCKCEGDRCACANCSEHS